MHLSNEEQDMLYYSGMSDTIVSYLKPLTDQQKIVVKRIRTMAILDDLAENIQNANDKHQACMEDGGR